MSPERALLISAGSLFILINLTLFGVIAVTMLPPAPQPLANAKLFVPLR